MFIKIMRRSFWSWWDNISYSIFVSMTAAVNPFFILLIASIWAFYTEVQFFVSNDSLFLVIIMTCVFAMPFFPTSLAGFRLQGIIIRDESNSLVRDYWESLKAVFWRGLLHSIVYGAAGLGLAYSILYYRDFLGHLFPLNYILIGVSMWFAMILFMMQSVIVPLIAEEDYRFTDFYKIALVYTMRNIFPLLLMAFMHILAFVMLTIPVVSPFLTVVPIVAYFGLIATMHNWTFMYVDGQVELSEDIPRRQLKELFSPFRLLKKKKDSKDGIDSEELSEDKIKKD